MKFNDYIIVRDCVEYTPTENNPRGFSIRATIAFDDDATVIDSEHYSMEHIQSWLDGNWFFGGVILSVWKSGVCLSDHAASLWGIECNFPNTSNSYLSEIVKELEIEALQDAEIILQKLID